MPNVIITGEESFNKAVLPDEADPDIRERILQISGVHFNSMNCEWKIPHYSLPFFVDIIKSDMFLDIMSNNLANQNYKTVRDYYEYLCKIKEGSADIDQIIGDLDIKAEFYPHQRIGLAYLIISNGVALVGDEMGVGKCLESLSYAVWLKANRNISKVLIVCPNSIKYSVWAKEIKKWTHETFNVVEGDKNNKARVINNCKSFFLIANYESVRESKSGTNLLKNFQEWNPDFCIVDEAHCIKNRTAKQTKSLKRIKTPYRILLTGTPILNKIDDLWSLLNYLRPDIWSNYNSFCEAYCIYQKKYFGGRGSRPVRIVSGYKNMDSLKKEITPIFIQRFKKDVLKYLPDKVYEDRYIPLLAEQAKAYNELVENFKTIIEGKEVKITKQLIIVQLTKLLQVCDTLACLGGKDISSKLDEVESIIDDMKGHKIVIFCWYKPTGKSIEQRLLKKKISVVRIDGDTPMGDRTKYVEDFQDKPDPMVFISTISSSGLGITLTSADVCIFVSRCYVPGINRQAEDRLHRPGQKNVVNIINIYSENTVDNRVKEILELKDDLFDAFTKEDLMREVMI